MSPSKTPPSPRWLRLKSQSARLAGAVRAGEWWEHKAAPTLGTAYAAAVLLHAQPQALPLLLLKILFALAACAAYASVLNDITDVADDAACGKKNRMAAYPLPSRYAVLGACLAAGILAGWFFRALPVTRVLYGLDWVAFTLYSVPPMRLKSRGAWGLLMDSGGASVLPHLWAAFTVAEGTSHGLPPAFVLLLCFWSLASGLRGILWHQLLDRQNDRRAAVSTFAARADPRTIVTAVQFVLFPIELGAMVGLLALTRAPYALPALALYFLLEYLRSRWLGIDIVLVNPTAQYRLLLAEFYVLFYPALFLLALTRASPFAWWFVPIHFLLFWQGPFLFGTHAAHLVRWRVWPRLRRLGG